MRQRAAAPVEVDHPWRQPSVQTMRTEAAQQLSSRGKPGISVCATGSVPTAAGDAISQAACTCAAPERRGERQRALT